MEGVLSHAKKRPRWYVKRYDMLEQMPLEIPDDWGTSTDGLINDFSRRCIEIPPWSPSALENNPRIIITRIPANLKSKSPTLYSKIDGLEKCGVRIEFLYSTTDFLLQTREYLGMLFDELITSRCTGTSVWRSRRAGATHVPQSNGHVGCDRLFRVLVNLRLKKLQDALFVSILFR
jgi:hypothetical protein